MLQMIRLCRCRHQSGATAAGSMPRASISAMASRARFTRSYRRILRRLLLPALAFVAGGVGHGVGLVEDDDAVEAAAEPVDDLLHAARLLAARLGAQSGVGGEEDAFLERDRSALPEA